MKNKLQFVNGFTLIELLVVISIIGILIALSVFGLLGARESARDAKRKTDLEQIRSGLEIYKADCGDYPTGSLTPGATLIGDNSPASCSSDNTYISLVPYDPLYNITAHTGPVYVYTKTDIGKYTLCATLEQSTTSWCVSNP